jgi:hypothetical protein
MLTSELITFLTESINDHGDLPIGIHNFEKAKFGAITGIGIIRDSSTKKDKIVVLRIKESPHELL